MADKTYTLTLTGPAETVDAMVDAFAAAIGWIEASDITKLESVRRGLRDYMLEAIRQDGPRRAAEVARLAALEATTVATDAVQQIATLTLIVAGPE